MQPSLSGPTICTTVRMEGRSYQSRKEERSRFGFVSVNVKTMSMILALRKFFVWKFVSGVAQFRKSLYITRGLLCFKYSHADLSLRRLNTFSCKYEEHWAYIEVKLGLFIYAFCSLGEGEGVNKRLFSEGIEEGLFLRGWKGARCPFSPNFSV